MKRIKKTYYVTLECIAHHTVKVEADSFEDARQKSMNVEIPKSELTIEEALPIHAEDEDGKVEDY